MLSEPKKIYLSHFFSSWGDRMWSYAVAVFLMRLDSGSLLLAATYGLVISGSVMICGSSAGHWIDRMPRLRSAAISLIVQNSSVAAFAVILLTYEVSKSENFAFLTGVKVCAMILGAIAQIAGVALSIIIQKDWIIVLADGNESLLSNLNSVLRRIDLTTNLIAPFACGQIITFGSLVIGCGFIAGWNVFSMFIEYMLLREVYRNTPGLALKKRICRNESAVQATWDATQSVDREDNPPYDVSVENDDARLRSNERKPQKEKPFCHATIQFISAIPACWRLYISQPTALAGTGLSFLYMTVLGVDVITNAYALSQCFSAALVGVVVGASAITGIVSTFLYSPLVAKFGITKTGLISSFAHVVTLVPCMMSVFSAGSPFLGHAISNSTSGGTTLVPNTLNASLSAITGTVRGNSTGVNPFLHCDEGVKPPDSYFSMFLLVTGIVLGRIGLWVFDLSVIQLFQENVREENRGVVGGVQNSMNSLMDLLHYLLVITHPNPNQFGFLIILSAVSVVVGHSFYFVYAMKHLIYNTGSVA